jgi:hypothetical protein
MTSRDTSRRALLTGAVAVPVASIACTAPTSMSAAERRLFEIEAEVKRVNRQVVAAGKLIDEAQYAMLAWERRNPKPRKPEIKEASQRETDDYIRAFQVADDPQQFCREHPSPNAQARAALEQYYEEMERWGARKRVAERQCGYDARQAAFDEAVRREDEVRYQAAGIRAATLEGLRVKARLAQEFDPGRDDHAALAQSIINDLSAWPVSV